MDETSRLVFAIFAGLLGLLVGSFLNVCIFRLPRNCMSIVRPRSRCTACLTLIAWYDNVPVLSYLLLRGRCRRCRARISLRYPMVELLTGALFVYAAVGQLYHSDRPTLERVVWFSVQAYLTGALIACTFIDLDFRILPDEITLSGIVIGLACGAIFPFLHRGVLPGSAWAFLQNPHVAGGVASLVGALVGAGVTYTVRVVGELVYKKEAMGLGDVKFLAFLGAFLGWKGILLTFLLGCLVGALYGIGHFIVKRELRGVQVPFGPFLAAGALAVLFFLPEIERLIQVYLDLFRRS